MQIARDHDIPFRTVTYWHYLDKWSKALQDYTVKVQQNLKNKIAEDESQKIFDARELTIEEYYDLCDLENSLEPEFRNGIKANKLKALKQVADIDGLNKGKPVDLNVNIPIFNGQSVKNVSTNDGDK